MLALVLLFSSAFNPVETGLKEGKQAPMLKLKNSEGAVTLSELICFAEFLGRIRCSVSYGKYTVCPRNRQKRNRKH